MNPPGSVDRTADLAAVDEVLDRFFADAIARAGERSVAFRDLWEDLQRGAAGGKRVRPRLVIAAYRALGGTDTTAVATAAAAMELLHTALIVHDDVIDRDFVRRGAPNVSGTYRDKAHTAGLALPLAEHRGMGAAVIAGDLALAGAFRLMRSVDAAPDVQRALNTLLDDAVYESAAGELIDLDFSVQRASIAPVEDILDMERLKTAVYTFEAPLQAGALLAEASSDVVRALGVFGVHVGTAYQIVDDILGVFGNEVETGKPVIGDLREGKQTVLIGFAAQAAEWDEIARDFGDPGLSEVGAERIRELLVSSGALERTSELARRHAASAREVLAGPLVPRELADELEPLVADAVERIR